MLKVSAFYLEKQKSFIPKKKYFFGRCQYQNKKALFTDSIFQKVLANATKETFASEIYLREFRHYLFFLCHIVFHPIWSFHIDRAWHDQF